jgi:hypothetical protein
MTKASKLVKLKPSTGVLKPWEGEGINRNTWYSRKRLAAAQLDVARPGAGDKSVAGPPFDYGGLTRRQTAELVLFKITIGEFPATPARVAAAKELIRLSRDGVGDADSATWSDVLDSSS